MLNEFFFKYYFSIYIPCIRKNFTLKSKRHKWTKHICLLQLLYVEKPSTSLSGHLCMVPIPFYPIQVLYLKILSKTFSVCFGNTMIIIGDSKQYHDYYWRLQIVSYLHMICYKLKTNTDRKSYKIKVITIQYCKVERAQAVCNIKI